MLEQLKQKYEIYKPRNTEEKIETYALVVAIGALAVTGKAIYDELKSS